jgi:TRAP-type mannitol/chloroaromatic compound transport system permease large subunit
MDLAAFLPLLFLTVVFGALFAGYSVAFTLAGTSLIFAAVLSAFGLFEPRLLLAVPSRIYNLFADDTLISIPLFVLMGTILDRTRIASDLLETMGRALGRIPGGVGISVCIVGALLGAATGVIGATVVTMALISLPTMLRHGYPPSLACGLICAAGALTQVIPPATVLILLGDQIGNAYAEAQRAVGNWAARPVSIVDLYAGAMIPGLLLATAYAGYVMAYAVIGSSHFKPEADAVAPVDPHWSEMWRAMIAPPLLLVSVLGSIIFGIATPTEGAGIGVAGAVILAGIREGSGFQRAAGYGIAGIIVAIATVNLFDVRITRGDWTVLAVAAAAVTAAGVLALAYAFARGTYEIGRRDLLRPALLQTIEITAMVYGILIGASFFSLVFYGLGGDRLVGDLFRQLPGGSAGAMVFAQVVIFLLGFPLENTEIISIAVPILAPSLLQTVDPIWFGVVTAVNLQTSYISPPVGFALFYLRNVVPASISTATIWRGALPFLAIQLVVMLILILEPRLSTWLPSLLPQ